MLGQTMCMSLWAPKLHGVIKMRNKHKSFVCVQFLRYPLEGPRKLLCLKIVFSWGSDVLINIPLLMMFLMKTG